MAEYKYYLIKSGPIKTLIDEYRAGVAQFNIDIAKYAEDRGATQYFKSDFRELTAFALQFKRNEQPEGWTMPNAKGQSWPKKNSKDYKTGFPVGPYEQKMIIDAINMPCNLSYKTKDGSGSRALGGLYPCQFLYSGSYECLLLTDIESEVKEHTDQGDIVEEPAASWKLDVEGLEEITKDKWKLLLLQEKVAKQEAA